MGWGETLTLQLDLGRKPVDLASGHQSGLWHAGTHAGGGSKEIKKS